MWPYGTQWQEVLAVGPLISTSKSSQPPGALQEIETRAQIRQWLDTQEHSSVLYVSFGSLLTLTENNIRELALGLEACGQPFVWVFRPPNVPQVIVTDDLTSTGLPTGAHHTKHPSHPKHQNLTWKSNIISDEMCVTLFLVILSSTIAGFGGNFHIKNPKLPKVSVEG